MENNSEREPARMSYSHQALFAGLSLILGAGALWYAWMRYLSLTTRAYSNWYDWIQPSMVVLFGMLCLWSTVLFVGRHSAALSYFKLGLSIIPVTLFMNLVILLVRAIGNLLQGNTTFLLDRILSQPYKFVLIPIVIIALFLLGSLGKSDEQKAK